jgi:hypothetical protein
MRKDELTKLADKLDQAGFSISAFKETDHSAFESVQINSIELTLSSLRKSKPEQTGKEDIAVLAEVFSSVGYRIKFFNVKDFRHEEFDLEIYPIPCKKGAKP